MEMKPEMKGSVGGLKRHEHETDTKRKLHAQDHTLKPNTQPPKEYTLNHIRDPTII